jgi:hypothetical protein
VNEAHEVSQHSPTVHTDVAHFVVFLFSLSTKGTLQMKPEHEVSQHSSMVHTDAAHFVTSLSGLSA